MINRLQIVTFSVLVILVIGLAVILFYAVEQTGYFGATETMTNNQRTATSIILGVTETEQRRLTAPPPSNTPNALQLTATSLIHEVTQTQQAIITATPPTPTNTLDPNLTENQLTATSVIRGATQTQQAISTASPPTATSEGR